MKNISITLNILLLLAVGFLYYKQFSGTQNKTLSDSAASDSLNHSLPSLSISTIPKDVPVVFINADTLFAQYELAKKSKAASEAKTANYQKSYQSKVASFQKEYTEYMEKAGAGGYTKEQGLAIEEGLQKKRDEIMQMEQNQEKMLDELDNTGADIQKKIYEYLSRFNKEHGYYCALAYTLTGGGVLGVNDSLDVTYKVIEGLNAEYNAGKKK